MNMARDKIWLFQRYYVFSIAFYFYHSKFLYNSDHILCDDTFRQNQIPIGKAYDFKLEYSSYGYGMTISN